jgi:hypothetical protein
MSTDPFKHLDRRILGEDPMDRPFTAQEMAAFETGFYQGLWSRLSMKEYVTAVSKAEDTLDNQFFMGRLVSGRCRVLQENGVI